MNFSCFIYEGFRIKEDSEIYQQSKMNFFLEINNGSKIFAKSSMYSIFDLVLNLHLWLVSNTLETPASNVFTTQFQWQNNIQQTREVEDFNTNYWKCNCNASSLKVLFISIWKTCQWLSANYWKSKEER